MILLKIVFYMAPLQDFFLLIYHFNAICRFFNGDGYGPDYYNFKTKVMYR